MSRNTVEHLVVKFLSLMVFYDELGEIQESYQFFVEKLCFLLVKVENYSQKV